jgi:hypothetical protein
MPYKEHRSRNSGFKRETDLLRRVNTRQERRSVLVVTNGISTEVDYFDALRREGVPALSLPPSPLPGAR